MRGRLQLRDASDRVSKDRHLPAGLHFAERSNPGSKGSLDGGGSNKAHADTRTTPGVGRSLSLSKR